MKERTEVNPAQNLALALCGTNFRNQVEVTSIHAPKIMNSRTTFRKAFAATLPVMAGYAVLGIDLSIPLKGFGFLFLSAFATSAFRVPRSLPQVTVNDRGAGPPLVSSPPSALFPAPRLLFHHADTVTRPRPDSFLLLPPRALPLAFLAFSLRVPSLSGVCGASLSPGTFPFCWFLGGGRKAKPYLILFSPDRRDLCPGV